MKVRLKSDAVVLIADTEEDAAEIATWKEQRRGFVFVLANYRGAGAHLAALGPQPQACREPINVQSGNPDPQIRLIANLAPTPLTLDGVHYACVEAFWQSLRFPPEERPRIAAMDGPAAKDASYQQPYGTHVHYRGEAIPVGTYAHWQLMRRACRAKFEQNEDACAALLATGERPLIHRVRRDSRTIPGVVMADIWMALRTQLRRKDAPARTS